MHVWSFAFLKRAKIMFCFSFYFQWSATEEDRVVPLKKITPWSQSPSWICNALHMTFICFPKTACKGKKKNILKGEKVSNMLKRERKVQKRERKVHCIYSHIFWDSVSFKWRIFFNRLWFQGFFLDPPWKSFFDHNFDSNFDCNSDCYF